jgi:OmpA-OmpF porin, OOP family
MGSKKALFAGLIGAAAILAVPSVSLAQSRMQDTPWYVGADIGQADLGVDEDTAFRILGGYQINRNFAAEISYSDFGDAGTGSANVKANAWELVGVGSYPLANQFSVFGKLGFALVEVKALGVTDDKTELTYGFGVQYDFTPKVGIRGQWQRYDTDPNEVDVLSIGVVYKF